MTRRKSVAGSCRQEEASGYAPGLPQARPARRADGSPDWSVLMGRAQKGDDEAYRCLLESVRPYLRWLATRRGIHRDQVDDAVQDILVTVHDVRHTYDPARPFGPWLTSIAARRIVDLLRRQGRIAARELPFEDEHESVPGNEASVAEHAVDARTLREAIERLPAGQREAIRMLKLEEMSLKEAASASSMTVAALKVAVHRGVKSMRKLFDKRERTPR